MPDRSEPMIIGDYGLRIALKLLPIIKQEIGYCCGSLNWLWDIPCKINLGAFEIPTQPVFYYWVRQNKTHYFIGFGVNHWRDYTHFLPGKLVDQHPFDFEAVLIESPKYNPLGRPPDHRKRQIITVCHKNMLTSADYQNQIWIEKGGHGVHPGPYRGGNNPQTINKNFQLIPIPSKAPDQAYWQAVQEAFAIHGVGLPWTWNHTSKEETKGWFWRAPERLLEELIDRR